MIILSLKRLPQLLFKHLIVKLLVYVTGSKMSYENVIPFGDKNMYNIWLKF
jgi:hypothetical protein